VPFRLVLHATNETHATRASEAAFQRIAQLNAILSDYDPESEVSRLCRETIPGQPAKVSPELWFMLECSQRLAAETDGAFDVTVGPLVNLWRHARRRQELPPEDLLMEARERAGWQKLRLDAEARTLTFLAPDMRLDFGGIAKGYAGDEALRVLRQLGIPSALVAAAGDVTIGDAPPDEPGWRIEIASLDVTNAPPPRTVWLHNAAVSTSGDIFQRLEIAGRRYSHIIDPRTGFGLTDHSLVSVIAPDGVTADSLATAVSVLGPERGLRLIERKRDCAALVVREVEGQLMVSTSGGFGRFETLPRRPADRDSLTR
jgi:FAD:protein FMN transferase